MHGIAVKTLMHKNKKNREKIKNSFIMRSQLYHYFQNSRIKYRHHKNDESIRNS